MDDVELENWVEQQRSQVIEYLEHHGIENRNVGEWSAFEVAPASAIWAVESKKVIGKIGWWAAECNR